MIRRFVPLLTLALTLSACGRVRVQFPEIPGLPTPVCTPVSTPTGSPTATTTPSPELPHIVQMVDGEALIRFHGLEKLPLRRGFDNVIGATVTYEVEGLDREKALLEISFRGTSPLPCQQAPCGQDMGLIVRMSSNLACEDDLDWNNREHESLLLSCGDGLNYHRRLALGPLAPGQPLDVWIDLTPDRLTVWTPVDELSWAIRRPGTFGIGRVIPGAPWPRAQARGYGWDAYSGTLFGLAVSVPVWRPRGVQQVPESCQCGAQAPSGQQTPTRQTRGRRD